MILLGWQFDPRVRLRPERPEGQQAKFGRLLLRLKDERPELDIRLLIWRVSLPVAAAQGFMPYRALRWFHGSGIDFHLDGKLPFGATQHQKLIVVDDELAFCSGADFLTNRWDTQEHREVEPARRTAAGRPSAPRHTTTLMVQGPVAAAVGEHARARWKMAAGEDAPSRAGPAAGEEANEGALWPGAMAPVFTGARAPVSRTMPASHSPGGSREVEAMYVAAIRAARRVIYMENQYFSSPLIARELQRRLREAGGPDIVLITGQHAPNALDRLIMDPPRDALLARLIANFPADRFGAFVPFTARGTPLAVHSKLMIVDDRYLRVGSANLSNRSFGYDWECDLTLEVPAVQEGDLARLRNMLLGHFSDLSAAGFQRQVSLAGGGVLKALAALASNKGARLRRLCPDPPRFPRSLIAKWHLGDPEGVADAWRPWRT